MKFLKNDSNRWQMVVDYPILAVFDKEKPQEVIVAHLTNGMPELITQLLNKQGEFTKNFVCFARTNQPSLNSEINCIVMSDQDLYLYTISLEKAFDRSSW